MLVTNPMAACPSQFARRPSPFFGTAKTTVSVSSWKSSTSPSRAGRDKWGGLKATGLLVDRRDTQWARYHRNPRIAPEIATIVTAMLDALPSDAGKAL
jgi:hypothetical protein